MCNITSSKLNPNGCIPQMDNQSHTTKAKPADNNLVTWPRPEIILCENIFADIKMLDINIVHDLVVVHPKKTGSQKSWHRWPTR